MRAICFALVMLSGLSLSSIATPLEDQAFTICPRRDPKSLRDCYIELLRTFTGHPRERARMDPRDAAVFCERVAGERQRGAGDDPHRGEARASASPVIIVVE